MLKKSREEKEEYKKKLTRAEEVEIGIMFHNDTDSWSEELSRDRLKYIAAIFSISTKTAKEYMKKFKREYEKSLEETREQHMALASYR